MKSYSEFLNEDNIQYRVVKELEESIRLLTELNGQLQDQLQKRYVDSVLQKLNYVHQETKHIVNQTLGQPKRSVVGGAFQ